MNQRDLATLLAPHITDSETWCRMTQVCRRFRDVFNSLLIKQTDINCISFTSHTTKWTELPSNGLKHGICQIFFKNGEISYEYTCKNGMLHGVKKSWYESHGQLEYIYNYKNDAKHGFQVMFCVDGKTRSKKLYINGIEME